LQLDDWVLCRIYNKKGVIERYDTVDDDEEVTAAAAAAGVDDVKPAAKVAAAKNTRAPAAAPMKVEMADYGGYYDDYDLETPSAGMLCFNRPSAVATVPALAPTLAPVPALAPAAALSPTEPDPDRDSSSMLWTNHTDNSSSGSEHVLSPSPDLPDRDHAESQPGVGGGADWWSGGDYWRGAAADDGFEVMDDCGELFGGPPSPGLFARVDAAAFGDMLTYLQRQF
jgi:hypothetical protein